MAEPELSSSQSYRADTAHQEFERHTFLNTNGILVTSVAKAKRCKGVFSVFLRGMALIFAIVFILLGILGFIPLTPNHVLFNFFTVGILLSIFYILIGLLALSASGSMFYARLYFKFLGIIFAAIAIWGFAMNGDLRLVHIDRKSVV